MNWRDLGAGEVRPGQVGERHTFAGWVARRRDHGGLIFVDLRDETGICQLVVNPERSPEAAKQAHGIRNEFVLQAEGEVVARAADAVNPNLPTGEVEIQVDVLRILSRSTPLPFQLDEEHVDETLRLRYRWLDMRRDKMQREQVTVQTPWGPVRGKRGWRDGERSVFSPEYEDCARVARQHGIALREVYAAVSRVAAGE